MISLGTTLLNRQIMRGGLVLEGMEVLLLWNPRVTVRFESSIPSTKILSHIHRLLRWEMPGIDFSGTYRTYLRGASDPVRRFPVYSDPSATTVRRLVTTRFRPQILHQLPPVVLECPSTVLVSDRKVANEKRRGQEHRRSESKGKRRRATIWHNCQIIP